MQTPMYCITETGLNNGEFYRDCERYNTKHKFDKNISEKLWQKSQEMIVDAKNKMQ